MIYVLTAGDPAGSHEVFTVLGPAGLDLAALWKDFKGPIEEFLGDEPDVTERSRWYAWHSIRRNYLGGRYRELTGCVITTGPFMLTQLFKAWLCSRLGCTAERETRFETENE